MYTYTGLFLIISGNFYVLYILLFQFFSKNGVHGVLSPEKMFNKVTKLDIEGTGADFIAQVNTTFLSLLCFWYLPESNCLHGTLLKLSKFANFCCDSMINRILHLWWFNTKLVGLLRYFARWRLAEYWKLPNLFYKFHIHVCKILYLLHR